MNKPQYPQGQGGGQQQMYQASDGKWYPVTDMPQGWQGQGQQQGQQQYGQQQQGYYGQQQPMYPQSQPVYVQQQRPSGGMGAGGGLLAGLCAGLLCFDLGACLC